MADGVPYGAGAPTFPGSLDPDQLAAVLRALQGPQNAGPASADMPGQSMPQQVPQDVSAPTPQLPTLLGLRPPEMPQAGLQQDVPAPVRAQLPSLAGSPLPAMSPAGGNAGRPEGIPPTARPATSLAPIAPSGVDDAEDAPNANLPMVRAVPQPPARPAEFGVSATAAPAITGAITGAPAMTGPASSASKPNRPPVNTPQADDGGLDIGRALKRFGDSGLGDTLLAFGGGLLSGRNWNEGLGAGFSAAGRVGQVQAASNLANAELQLKQNKVLQEQRQLTGNAALLKRAYPQLSDAELLAQAGNSAAVTSALNILRDPTHGLPKTPEQMQAEAEAQARGSMLGGAKPADRIRDEAQAQAAGTAAGQPAADYTLGQSRYSGETNQPIATAAPDKPQGYDTESKLRGEFAKGLGSFSDVHDGYGRVIAATRQREANPNGVSPASDIGLIFGYMKMLDPGSVVREGEYATAANATGIPERVRNAYNKAMNGEFLTGEQRQDFLGQAAELYGTARKTAEGVAGRYRNLATQYGADPDRTTYLPEMPSAPTVGRDRMKPAGGQGGQGGGQSGPQQAPNRQEAAQPPQGTPSGARQAADGNWYVSDPNRPGKYLKVQ